MNRRKVLIGGAAVALTGGGAAYAGLRRVGSMEGYEASVAAVRRVLPAHPEAQDLIRYATLAPNGHNTQPWRFQVLEDGIAILPDPLRRTPVVDPDDHHLFVGLGAAMENLGLAAGARGRPGTASFDAAAGGSVVFTFGAGPATGPGSLDPSPRDPGLFAAIPGRQSTRADYDGRPVSTADLRSLTAAAVVPGVDLVLITDRPGIEQVRDLVVAGNSAQMADAAFVRELKSWMRFSPTQAARAGDGLFTAASGNPVLPALLGTRLFDWAFTAKAGNREYANQMRSSPGVAVFASERADRDHWVRTGRACQRFALQATALGLKHAFINQPVEVASLRPALADIAGVPGRRPDIVMRFGYGPALPFSARRPVEAVMA